MSVSRVWAAARCEALSLFPSADKAITQNQSSKEVLGAGLLLCRQERNSLQYMESISLAKTSLAFEGTRHAHAAHIHVQAKTITHIKIKMNSHWISDSKDYTWVVASWSFLVLFCFLQCWGPNSGLHTGEGNGLSLINSPSPSELVWIDANRTVLWHSLKTNTEYLSFLVESTRIIICFYQI